MSHGPHPKLGTTKCEVEIEIVVCFSFVLLLTCLSFLSLFKEIFSLCFVLLWISDFLHCSSSRVAFKDFVCAQALSDPNYSFMLIFFDSYL